MTFKNLFVWLTIFLISIALVITSFIINPKSKEKNNNITKIFNKTIYHSDIKNIIEIIKIKNAYLKNIDDVDTILKSLIIDNIKKNISIKNNGLNITKNELLNTILTLESFKSNEKFSETLYKNFLEKNKLTEFSFQNKLLINLKKKKINDGFKLIESLYEKKFKNNYAITHKNENFKRNINTAYKTKISDTYKSKIKLINLSNKEALKHLYLKKKVNTIEISTKNFVLLELYVLKSEKVKKIKIFTNDEELSKSSRINDSSNLLIIKKAKFEKMNIKNFKEEIINLNFKKNVIDKLLTTKKYIKKKEVKKDYAKLFNVVLHSTTLYTRQFCDIKTVNKIDFKNNDFFLIKNE